MSMTTETIARARRGVSREERPAVAFPDASFRRIDASVRYSRNAWIRLGSHLGIDPFINSVSDIKIFFQAHVLEKDLPGTMKCSVQNAMAQGATRQETLENTPPCPWHITR